MKPSIPFKILDKYKYFFFPIVSLVMAILAVIFTELINLVDGGGGFTLKYLMHKFFFVWGFMYPASFVMYESAKKRYKKTQERDGS